MPLPSELARVRPDFPVPSWLRGTLCWGRLRLPRLQPFRRPVQL